MGNQWKFAIQIKVFGRKKLLYQKKKKVYYKF